MKYKVVYRERYPLVKGLFGEGSLIVEASSEAEAKHKAKAVIDETFAVHGGMKGFKILYAIDLTQTA